MSQLIIRDLRPEDRDQVRRVCFETGMMGGPIVDQYRDFESFADMFTAYYTDIEPENSVVAELDGKVVGYMLCALDERKIKTPTHYMLQHAFTRAACFRPGTFGFYVRSAFDMVADLFGPRPPKMDFERFPSAPHINLLPEARRYGGGSEMFFRVFDHLVSRGSKGMHGAIVATNRPMMEFATKKIGCYPVGNPFPVVGLRTPKGERVSLQTIVADLSTWEIGAWKRPDFSVSLPQASV